jgi:hypothetical protein
MPRWCCKRLLAKQRCGWGGQEGDWCGPQYENHNLRLGSEALRKHAVSIPPKGITRLLFQAQGGHVHAGQVPGQTSWRQPMLVDKEFGMELCGRGRLRGVVCRVKRRRKRK